MKDLVYCSLDDNIPVQGDAAEKKLVECTVEAIKYYCLVQLPMPTESIFLWLAQLSPLVGPATNLSKNYSKNNNDMSDKGSGNELKTKEKPPIHSNCTKSKSLRHNYSKSNGDISYGGSADELETKEKPLSDPNGIKSKSLSYNYGKNNINMSKIKTGKGLEIEDLEVPE